MPPSTLLRRTAPLVALLAFTLHAHAQDTAPDPSEAAGTAAAQKTMGQLLSDLNSMTASNRLYAARALHTQLKAALRTADHGKEGSIAQDEALSKLIELEARVPDSCGAAMQYDNAAPSCAEMLAMLNVTTAKPQLTEALGRVKGAGPKRRIQGALDCLDGVGRCPQQTEREWEAAQAPK